MPRTPSSALRKKGRVKWKKGMWRLLGRGNNNEAQMESRKKGPCKVQTGMGQEYICFFLMLKKTLRQRARTRKERLFLVACDFFFLFIEPVSHQLYGSSGRSAEKADQYFSSLLSFLLLSPSLSLYSSSFRSLMVCLVLWRVLS